MRKQVRGKKFSRKIGPRKAMLNSVARALFIQGKIQTTETKAKEASRLASRIITNARKGDLTSLRYVLQYMDTTVAKKVVNEIAPKYRERPGGYTRIIHLEPRVSDGARMVILELV